MSSIDDCVRIAEKFFKTQLAEGNCSDLLHYTLAENIFGYDVCFLIPDPEGNAVITVELKNKTKALDKLVELYDCFAQKPYRDSVVSQVYSYVKSLSDGKIDTGNIQDKVIEFIETFKDVILKFKHELAANMMMDEMFKTDDMDFIIKSMAEIVQCENEHDIFPSGFQKNFLASDIRRRIELMFAGKCKSLDEIAEVSGLKLLSNYRPLCKLGSGRVSSVYLVRNTLTDKEIAVKIARPEFSDAKWHSVVIEHIAELQNLSNPYVVRYYEPQIINGRLMIFMEPFKCTLEKKIADRVPFAEAMKYFKQMVEGLSTCYSVLSIVHHDLAPCNIGIDSNSDVKLTDFNLGVYKDRDELRPLGAIDYKSPELLSGTGSEITCTDNIWSLGVILYEMLTQTKLFSPARGTIDKNNQREEYGKYILEKQRKFQERLESDATVLDEILDNIHIAPEEACDFMSRIKWQEFDLFDYGDVSYIGTKQSMPDKPKDCLTKTKDVLRKIFYACFCRIPENDYDSKKYK